MDKILLYCVWEYSFLVHLIETLIQINRQFTIQLIIKNNDLTDANSHNKSQ